MINNEGVNISGNNKNGRMNHNDNNEKDNFDENKSLSSSNGTSYATCFATIITINSNKWIAKIIVIMVMIVRATVIGKIMIMKSTRSSDSVK